MLSAHVEKLTTNIEHQTDIKGKALTGSYSQMFFKMDVTKTFAIFTGKRLCGSLLLRKL